MFKRNQSQLSIEFQNIAFLCHLTKFKIVPFHVILHVFKVCLDDFTGTNVDNIAMLLEGCGRFLLRSEDTAERFGTMVRLSSHPRPIPFLTRNFSLNSCDANKACNTLISVKF